MTFGDKIRSMSNGEFAEFLQKILNCDTCDFGDCKSCLFGSNFCPFDGQTGKASRETLVKFLNHEALVYEDLISEWFDRKFTDKETKFVQDTLKEKIRKGDILTPQECEIANDSWYHATGDLVDSSGGCCNDVEIILSIDDEFYRLIEKSDSFSSFYEQQSAEKVVAKAVQVIKWTKTDEN